MSNIENAINKEKTYLNYRMVGEEPFHLIDAVGEFGFETLEEYFSAKLQYRIQNAVRNVTKCKQCEIVSEAMRILQQGLTGIWYSYSDEVCIFNGEYGNETYNAEYCSQNNIPIYSLGTTGGTIVHSPGDFSWGIALPIDAHASYEYFLNSISNIIQKYTEKSVVVRGNDILIDDKKVCGSTVYTTKNVFLFISYFSFSDKSELISKICGKRTMKSPGFIDCMSREELESEVQRWLL